MKIFVCFFVFVSFAFGQLMPVGEFDFAKVNAKKYGLMTPEEYFSGRKDFDDYSAASKSMYIHKNQKEYITYVNISIIEIAESKAKKCNLKDYDGFVRQVRKEPDITLERVDAFRRSGHYISEYEEYVKKNEWKKFIPKLW